MLLSVILFLISEQPEESAIMTSVSLTRMASITKYGDLRLQYGHPLCHRFRDEIFLKKSLKCELLEIWFWKICTAVISNYAMIHQTNTNSCERDTRKQKSGFSFAITGVAFIPAKMYHSVTTWNHSSFRNGNPDWIPDYAQIIYFYSGITPKEWTPSYQIDRSTHCKLS